MRADHPPARDWSGLAGAAAAALLGAWMLREAAGFSDLAAVFPRTIAIVMIAAAGLLAVRILVWPSVRRAAEGGSARRRVALVAVAALWVGAIPLAGFLAASLAGFFAAMLVARFEVWTARRAAVDLAAGAALVVGFYLLFEAGLGVPLPRGWLG